MLLFGLIQKQRSKAAIVISTDMTALLEQLNGLQKVQSINFSADQNTQ